jgi:hypothetical protein
LASPKGKASDFGEGIVTETLFFRESERKREREKSARVQEKKGARTRERELGA